MQIINIDHPLRDDFEYILEYTKELWREVSNKRIFITGATGFLGKWLLESFIWTKEKSHINAEITLLIRNFERFRKEMSYIVEKPYIRLHLGDVRTFDFPEGQFEYIIHLASASAEGKYANEDPVLRFDTIVQGTRRVLEFASQCGCEKFLYTSSGYVYGRQPNDVSHIQEDYVPSISLNDSNAPLGIGKLASEFLCNEFCKKNNFQAKIARCFSFVGPYLQLDIHYAIGNFIRDGLKGGPIIVKGDGTPYRSYLYAADLAIWLWTILFKGKSCRPYNVGSEEAITIKDLAYLVASCFEKPIEVKIFGTPDPTKPPERYVPSTARARTELGLSQTVILREAILKTITFLQVTNIKE